MTTMPELRPHDSDRMRFVFVRHGAADGVEGRCIGHTDVLLSQQGAAEIGQLVFNDSNVRSIATSDLSRAAHSARILAEAVGLPVTTDVRLREMNFGEWDGRLWSELEHSDGERLSTWMENWISVAAPSGETVAQLFARVASWLNEQLVQSHSGHSTVVVVAHAGSIRAAICLLTRMPAEQLFDVPVEHARATVVDFTVNGWNITKANTQDVS